MHLSYFTVLLRGDRFWRALLWKCLLHKTANWCCIFFFLNHLRLISVSRAIQTRTKGNCSDGNTSTEFSRLNRTRHPDPGCKTLNCKDSEIRIWNLVSDEYRWSSRVWINNPTHFNPTSMGFRLECRWSRRWFGGDGGVGQWRLSSAPSVPSRVLDCFNWFNGRAWSHSRRWVGGHAMHSGSQVRRTTSARSAGRDGRQRRHI